ncbi:MAG: acyl carrier protein [Alphaproteobacteria bacterium]|nr:acyl carrier protein [Alphaproteobacteria bacterium]
MPRDWLERRVCDGIAGLYGIAPDQVTLAARLIDLGTDSLRFAELVLWLHDRFGIAEPDGLESVETVGDLVGLIRRYL